MVYQSQLELRTSGHRDMHDITEEVAQIVRESEVRAGTVNVFNVGSTGAVGAIEFEPGLKRDLPEILDSLMPPSREYGHEQTWHDGDIENRIRHINRDGSCRATCDDLRGAGASVTVVWLTRR